MYNGKRVNKKTVAGAKRKAALLVSLVLLFTMTIGASVAFLIDATQEEKNVFTPAEVPPTIVETWPDDHLVKQNVKVTNTGNISAYIRAAIVVTWQDSQGNVAPVAPVLGTDYTMTLAEGNWSAKQDDGYYYYKGAVAANDPDSDTDTTGVLIKEAKQLVDNGEYTLVIEILAQTIQADGISSDGKTPVRIAWGKNAESLVTAK